MAEWRDALEGGDRTIIIIIIIVIIIITIIITITTLRDGQSQVTVTPLTLPGNFYAVGRLPDGGMLWKVTFGESVIPA
jgi:hypothetical protein